MERGPKRILIVDDELAVRNFCEKVFQSYGFTVITSSNGEEAIRKFLEGPVDVDLVMTDFGMSPMNGLELARKLREIKPKVPIVLHTAEHLPEDETRHLVDRVLTKPVRVSEYFRLTELIK